MPTVVDFWASWCMPCKVTKPILESLAREYADRVQLLLINVDECPDIAKHFRVSSIPTVLTLRDGKAVGRVTGAQNESRYRTLFDALIEGKNVKMPLAPLERLLRLGAGGLLLMVGISISNWPVMGLGGIIAFLGMYDRCPIWAALMSGLKRREN